MPKKNARTIPHHKREMLSESVPPSLIFRHNPKPWALVQALVHQLPFLSPYFMAMTLHHRCEVSWPYLQSHFPNRAWLKGANFWTLKKGKQKQKSPTTKPSSSKSQTIHTTNSKAHPPYKVPLPPSQVPNPKTPKSTTQG